MQIATILYLPKCDKSILYGSELIEEIYEW